MKKLICSLMSISFLSLLFIASTGSKAQAQDVTVSYQSFYDELSPYGQWVSDPEFGNVWVPNEDGNFRPYGSRGYWAMTEYGNTWISDDPWGWAVYHYGRWTYNSYYGWIWVPGYEWAPAWVSWRFGGGNCGWAPLSPGYYVGSSYGCPDNWWVFVGPRHLYRRDHYSYWGNRGNNHTYIRQTNIINNVYTDNHTHVQYNYGPRASTITQVTHQPVQVYRVSQSGRPGVTSIQQNTVNIYRPKVNSGSVNTARPSNVVQAPVNVGRPQTAQTGNTQPTFRQDVQRLNREGNSGAAAPANTGRAGNMNPGNNGNTGVVGPRQGNNPATDRNNAQPAPGRNNQNNAGRFDQAQPRNNPPQLERVAPGRFDQAQPRNNPAQQDRPAPGRFDQAQPRNNPAQQDRPAPGRFDQAQPRNNPAQQDRPAPGRFDQGQQDNHQEAPRNTPPVQQQQSRPEPQRYNPPVQQQQSRPEPQQPRQQAAPQQSPQQRPQPGGVDQRGGAGRR